MLQSGASSPAKYGVAYFSAVNGSIKDPIAAPGHCSAFCLLIIELCAYVHTCKGGGGCTIFTR